MWSPNRLVDSYLKAGETAAIALLALGTLAVIVSIATAALAGIVGDSAPAIEALLLSVLTDASRWAITGPLLGVLARVTLAYLVGLVLLVAASSTAARLGVVDED